MEIGIYSFGETTRNPHTDTTISQQERIHNLLEEIVLADEVGLDVFGLGEHHRPDFPVSSPATILAAAAVKTKNIRLSSAVSVLSSDDPIRVFQDFATIDLLSNGRAEIMAGRGSFVESFPLFGHSLDQYDMLFSEKLDLLLTARESEKVHWEGKHRAPLNGQGIYPRPVQSPLPVWVAVGGTPQSVVRAATLGLPLALAIIGGQPARFKPIVELYREVATKAGHNLDDMPVSINVHGHIADESRQAADEAYPFVAESMNRIGRERGWPPIDRRHFDQERSPKGAVHIGSPQEIIDKILYEHELFGNQRFLIQLTVGSIPHAQTMRAIELLGTKIAPAVRKAVAG